MIIYQCQLAWRSIRKNPILCLLMILSLACGIAATMTCYTLMYGILKNPLAHKDNNLFMLQTDSWNENEAYSGNPNNEMPDKLSYRDVNALMKSDIPRYKTAMTPWGGTVSIIGSDMNPFYEKGRVTTHDYFAMFEETFLYGAAWEKSADEHLQNVVVLSKQANERLFNGDNSVGKTILFERKIYQVVGVLNKKEGHKHRMQDIETFTLQAEDSFIFPFALLAEGEVATWGRPECPHDLRDYGEGYQAKIKNSCLWLTYWVEFKNSRDKSDYEAFITHYIESQKELGYYPRPLRFALSNATEKLTINGYNQGGFALLSYIGMGLLTVCIINCIAMLLAKFLRHSSESGIRRALGANRFTIFSQHIIESVFIGLLGGLLGILFTYIGIELLERGFDSGPAANGRDNGGFLSIFNLDYYLLTLTVTLALISSVCAGMYPAWRICRIPTSHSLKSQ